MSGEPIHQPHDKLLKATFSIPENARGLFRPHLPPDLAAAIAWDSLKVESSSFVDPRFAASESDLLFRIRIGQSDAYLYLLLEHQSSEDPRMALRVMGYIVRIWERFASTHPPADKLPPVLPVVLAQDNRPWTTSTRLEDIIGIPEAMAEQLRPWQPTLRFQLLELVRMRYEDIGGTPKGILALRALKAEPMDELLSDPVWEKSILSVLSEGALERVMRHLYDGNVSREEFAERIRRLHAEPLESTIMTLADQFRAEGLQTGLSQGRNEGRSEGQLQAMRSAILRTLELKHGPLPQSIAHTLASTIDEVSLLRLLDRAVLSSSLTQFAQDL